MDEAQLEVRKQQVTWKVFPVKGAWTVIDEKGKEVDSPEAEAAKKAAKDYKDSQTDKLWSDVGHSPKGYYVGYCRAGELAVEAVNETGRYYKLNVELTAGYMLGNSWASCH